MGIAIAVVMALAWFMATAIKAVAWVIGETAEALVHLARRRHVKRRHA